MNNVIQTNFFEIRHAYLSLVLGYNTHKNSQIYKTNQQLKGKYKNKKNFGNVG